MLPTNPKTEWPPPAAKLLLADIGALAAWYSDDIAALYPDSVGTGDSSWKAIFRRDAGARNLGNLRGQLDTLHVPMASDIARVSADLLFSESPAITCENEAAQVRLDAVLDEMTYGAMLVENAELCSALGGMFWRCTWDLAAVKDRPILSWVQPDYALPEWRWGLLSAVTFWEVLPTPPGEPAEQVWRSLERHGVGPDGSALIEHGLYVGTGDQLGRSVPLTEHPATAGIAASLTGTDGQSIALPGVPMTAGYIPNMRPNRKARGTALGRADIAGLNDVLRAIDRTWTSWIRDLDLGKARAIVPMEFLRDYGPGAGAGFDLDRAVYSGLNMPPPSSTGVSPITLMQFKIRVEEHKATLLALMTQAIRTSGYSLRSFGLGDSANGSGAMTATEVKAQERASMVTREKKTRYWTSGMEEQLECLMALDRFLRFAGSAEPGEITIEFADAVSEDPFRTAGTVELINRAAASSTETRIRMLHSDWDDEQVAEEVARIQEETSVPDPMSVPEALTEPMRPMMNGAPDGDAGT